MAIPLTAEKDHAAIPRQAVILCGGLGTRLGERTRTTPKPLLPVDGVPFLQILIQEIARTGIRRFVLLAAHFSEQIETFAREVGEKLGQTLEISVSIEPHLAGTAGALRHAAPLLDDSFFLLNGDSFFDLPLHGLIAVMHTHPRFEGVLALRYLANADRYGVVTMAGEQVTSFGEKPKSSGPGLINGGVYLFRRTIADHCPPQGSLETDVLPKLVEKGVIGGVRHDGFFLDIGIEEAYQQAQNQLPEHRRRPAIFLDRDGVLNHDHGHVGGIDRFEWNEGARETIRAFNDLGWYVFVVTNQAGIAKGKYGLADYWALRDHIRMELAAQGCQIDDERFCPYHPDASVPQWRDRSDWRKPEPGMLLDLLEKWPVRREMSFMIGDQETDVEAAKAAGLPGFRYQQGPLDRFALKCLDIVRAQGIKGG